MSGKKRSVERKAECHPDRKYFALGLCRQCYGRQVERNKIIENPKAFRAAKAKRMKLWRKSNPKRKKELARLQTLKKHGWSQERFENKREEQKNLCAICKVTLTYEDSISKTRACTDHKHVFPPMPRGLLCSACNAGLGQFKDQSHILERAAEYLRNWE